MCHSAVPAAVGCSLQLGRDAPACHPRVAQGASGASWPWHALAGSCPSTLRIMQRGPRPTVPMLTLRPHARGRPVAKAASPPGGDNQGRQRIGLDLNERLSWLSVVATVARTRSCNARYPGSRPGPLLPLASWHPLRPAALTRSSATAASHARLHRVIPAAPGASPAS
jgi:hypothetical protein